MTFRKLTAVAAFAALALATGATAQPPRGQRGPVVVSPEVKDDRSVVFRVLDPKAENVASSDLPAKFQPRKMTKGENGVWELTLGPIDAGTFRYLFNVDGATTADPRNPAVSESNGNVWSVVHVP